jgi:hypothetical protein
MFDVFYIDQINSIEDACNLSRTRYLWILDPHNDYSDFDLSWEPPPWEADQIHVWPSQHQQNGGTLLIPKSGATEKNYNHEIVCRRDSGPRLHIKHNPISPDSGDINARYISDYLGTMRRVLSKTEWEYCWVTSDVCTYTEFDFTWHPEEWQLDMLHVFPSNEQKFGDTFYVHVPSFLEKTDNLEVLEWFETLHFVSDCPVKRYVHSTVEYTDDSLVDAIWKHKFNEPIALFYKNKKMCLAPTISLWQERTKTVVPLSTGAECTLVPREAKNYLKTQLYDYPWIDKTHPKVPGTKMDIVYISYDEPEAEDNYQTLLRITDKLDNRVTRVHGIQGMENALKAAAEISNTPWVYNVFAKTELDKNFDFGFVPDYMQSPKHYIFNCRNASNGLEYGHMGVIMYNCNMVINAPPYNELGLDYTVSFPVEVVPRLSCHGNFATSAYHAWRTAFRESAKLAYFNSVTPSIETNHRLNVWTTHAVGDYREWVLTGAKDGVEFFEESNGSLDYLKQSFRWEWLRERFAKKYGDLT